MSDKRLLLPSAKIGILVETFHTHNWVRWFLFAIGVVVILIGALNLLFRISNYVGADAVQTAFTPLGSWGSQEPSASATTPITPARLRIPSIGVDASVEQVGTKADGSMATPKNFQDAGWYDMGARPGEAGNAVIAGHVNNALTMAGVFQHLGDIRVGDTIAVSDAHGTTLNYVVTETDQYSTTNAPTAAIFSTNGPSQIVLITCDGVWDPAAHSYDKRLVVYARLAR